MCIHPIPIMGVVVAVALSSLSVASSASATPTDTPLSRVSASSSSGLARTADVSDAVPSTERIERAGIALRESAVPRDAVTSAFGQRVTYRIGDGATITYTYSPGGAPVVGVPTQEELGRSLARAGADPFPYVSRDPSEQAAGAAGTLGLLICAALGPESGGLGCAVGVGIGATIVAVATAHGICTRNRDVRIYLPTLEVQCRRD